MLANSTISGSVEKGLSGNITHSNIHFKVGYKGSDKIRRIYNFDSIIDKYRDVLLSKMEDLEFTNDELEKYRYRPRTFCYDAYDNKDLWSILLRLNNMLTATDFDRKKIKTFGSTFVKTLEDILTMENDSLNDSMIAAKTE